MLSPKFDAFPTPWPSQLLHKDTLAKLIEVHSNLKGKSLSCLALHF